MTRWTMTLAAAAALFCMCTASSPAEAQATAIDPLAGRYVDPANGISLDRAIALGLERAPELQAGRASVDAARATRQQAELRPNPTITAMREQQIKGTDNTTAAEIEWPLDLFRRGGRIATADRAVEVAQYTVADRRRLLASDIRAGYGELLAAVRSLEIGDQLVAANRRSYDLLRARVDQGAAPPLERNIADVELRRLEAQRLVLAARAETALIALKRLLGVGPGADVKVRDTLEGVVQGAAPGEAPADLSTVAAGRSDVREADAKVQLADAAIDAARREGRFDIDLVGGYARMDFSFPQFGFGSSGELEPVQGIFHSVKIAAMVKVPLRNSNQGAIAAAQAERAGADHERRARALTAEAEVASAVALDQQARQTLAVYAAGLRDLARQNLDVVRQTYELGRVTLSDVLAEQRRYLETENGYTEALRTAFEARTALARALGDVR